MINMKTAILFCSLLFFVLSGIGCSSTNDTEVSIQTIPFTIVKNQGDVSYTFYSYQTYKEGFVLDKNGTTKNTFVLDTFKNSNAFFGLPTNRSAGAVALSGVLLTNISGTYTNNVNPDVVPNGQFKTWVVSGSGTIPTITDSVKGSELQIAFSSPPNAADVSISSPLNVTWALLGDTNEVVSIEMVGDKNGSNTYFETMANTGSYMIPSSTMSSLSTGHCTMVLRRGNYIIGTATNGKRYLMVSWTQAERDVNLTN